jgi:hypothetical protein
MSRRSTDTVPDLISVWDRYKELEEIGEGSYGRWVRVRSTPFTPLCLLLEANRRLSLVIFNDGCVWNGVSWGVCMRNADASGGKGGGGGPTLHCTRHHSLCAGVAGNPAELPHPLAKRGHVGSHNTVVCSMI